MVFEANFERSIHLHYMVSQKCIISQHYLVSQNKEIVYIWGIAGWINDDRIYGNTLQ